MAKLGKALRLTNEELDEAAEITTEDVERVNEEWQKKVHAIMRNALVAEQV
jgi:hypothetical protein